MSAALQYTLGLNAASFVSGLGVAQSRLAAATAQIRTQFLSIAAAITPVAAAARSAFGLGSELSDLALQTGESVTTLLRLRQAFTEAGLGGESVAQTLAMMRRALGGVNEDGQPTAKVFDRLGLSASQLRGMGAEAQLRAIGAAVSRLGSQSEQTAAVMQIFGRGGARMLQLFRDPAALDNAARAVGRLGPFMEQNAGAFDAVDDALSRLKLRWQEFAAGLAERLIPLLNRFMDAAGRQDWIRVGQQVGDAFARIGNVVMRIGKNISDAVGGPAGVAVLLARLVELKAVLAGIQIAGGALNLGRGLAGALTGVGPQIGSGIAAHLAGPAAALIGAAIAGQIVAGILEARSRGAMDAVMGGANDRAARLASLKKSGAAIASGTDFDKFRSDVSSLQQQVNDELAAARIELAKGSLVPGVREMLRARVQMLEDDRRALDQMYTAVERQRDALIARNAAAAERAAADAHRREQVEIAGRAQLAFAKMRFDPRERQADETDEEYARRSLQWAQERIAAIERETEAIRQRINAQKASADDAERAAALAEEFVSLRRDAVQLQLQLQRYKEPTPPKPEERVDARPGLPTLTDRLARVGGFVGGVTSDLARRQTSAAERSVKLLEQIARKHPIGVVYV
mgnify:CR=1 FL=1